MLQERLKVIKEELGLSFDKDSEVAMLREKISVLKAPEKIKSRLPIGIKLFSLRLQETESSYAEWFQSDNI